MTVLFKSTAIDWEMNAKAGYRKVGVSYNGNNILSVIANKSCGDWVVQAVPMGYTYSTTEVEVLADLYRKLPYLMNFIGRDVDISHEELLEFLSNIN